MFFREDWKEIQPEIPVSQEHVNNPELELFLHGPGKDSIKKSNHEKPFDDPYYIWSGLCTGTWALSLRHTGMNADLSSYAKIKWRTKQAGVRHLHIILKLSDGSWLVSREADGPYSDWKIREFNISDLNWLELNIETVTERRTVEPPDLSNVKQIGFTDLMPGGRSLACSRLDWIEVYAYPVER